MSPHTAAAAGGGHRLPPPVTLATVRGPYAAYAYVAGRGGDVGWGCAYRSAQTLASWALAAGAAAAARATVPTLRELQAALVAAGDKPPAFVGSASWVGAAEVALALDETLGVGCRLLHVRAGEAAAAAAPLRAHFAPAGAASPVMVGGGDRALTAVGIATGGGGTAALLVVDPHVVGGGAAAVRWVRLADLDATAFYNFCWPVPPPGV